MSLYKLRTRLERLERAKTIDDNDPDPARTFTIDPAVARALRDDYERACYLMRKEYAPSENGGPISAAEVEEKSRLFESIKKRARAIGCPSSYILILSPSQTAASVDIFMIVLVPQTEQRHRSANGLAAFAPQSQLVSGCFAMAFSFKTNGYSLLAE